jgi:hypothetical protein
LIDTPKVDCRSPGFAWRTAPDAAPWIGAEPLAAQPAWLSVAVTEFRRKSAALKK